MAKSSLYAFFSEPERLVLRAAMRKKAKERTVEETRLAREYYRLLQSRHRSGQAKRNDMRTNEHFRKWCAERGYSTKKFNRSAWEKFIREWS